MLKRQAERRREKQATRSAADLERHARRAVVIETAVSRSLIESLERRTLMAAAPVITEFSASNANGLVDGNGSHSDWIEIQNQGDVALDLTGWHLTDDATKPAKWTFPAKTLNAGAYLVVFASGNNVPDPAGNLHTNFSLSADGENLSLRQPDGTVVSEFGAGGTAYPKQVADISYGTSSILNTTPLLGSGAPARAFVPLNGSLDPGQWTATSFVDTSWKSGTTGVGYDGGGTASTATLLARWYAPSLALSDNVPVASWGAVTGTGTATQSSSSKRPTLQSDAASLINGKAVVRFDGTNDNLVITNQSLNGVANFTVAVVFRTTAAGPSGSQWYNNDGIVDAEVGGTTNDWGVAINNTGAVAGGVGSPDSTVYSASGLNNGAAHVAIFTKSGTTTALSIDGAAPTYGTASESARTINQLMFGSLNTNINFFAGDIGEVRLYNSALTDDAVRSLATEMDATWGITLPAGIYTPQIGLDLRTEMSNVASTAMIRVPFTVDNPAQFDTLMLNMKYDDGFVAYLNGTEVARRNVSGGAIIYISTANAPRSEVLALTAESINISSSVGLLLGNGATNILAIRALNASATDSDLLIVPELIAASSTPGISYMTTPTPGAANLPGYIGLVSPVTLSAKHGYFSAPVATTLAGTTPDATIVYTVDGSTPSLTNGTKVIPAVGTVATTTLNISSTTVVRAAAFRNGYLPSSVSAESYLFVSDIVAQPEFKPSGAYWDVGMDAAVVNAQQTYTVAQALKAIPTISLSIDNAEMFGGLNGIYTHPLERGDE